MLMKILYDYKVENGGSILSKYKIVTDKEWFDKFGKVAKQVEDLKFLFQNEGYEVTEEQVEDYKKEFYAAKRALSDLESEANFRIYFGKPKKIGVDIYA